MSAREKRAEQKLEQAAREADRGTRAGSVATLLKPCVAGGLLVVRRNGYSNTYSPGPRILAGEYPEAPAVLVPLTPEQIEEKSSDPHHSDTYLFNRHTLIDFVRAITNAQGAPDA